MLAEHGLQSKKDSSRLQEYQAVRAVDKSEASSITNVQSTGAMALTGGGSGSREDNNGGHPQAKRIRLGDTEPYLLRDCDVETTIVSTIDDAIAELDLRNLVKKKLTKLANIDELEHEIIDIDISFDGVERGLKKLREMKRLERIADLAPPEVHFLDDFTEADADIKMPQTASSEKADTC